MAPTKAQGNSANAVSTNATTLPVTLPFNVTAGNALVAYATGGTNPTSVSFSSPGDSWVTLTPFFDSTISQFITIGYSLNATGGSKTVTVTQAPSSVFRGILCEEYSDLPLTGAFDTNTPGRHNATSSTPSDATLTTAGAGELVVSCVIIDGNNTGFAVASGWTAGESDTGNFFLSEYQVQTSAGAIGGAWTASPTKDTGTMTAAFKPSSTLNSGPNYAGAAADLGGGSGTWGSTANADGAPDGGAALWTAP